MKILIERRRLIVQAFGWSLIDTEVLTRIPPPKPVLAVIAAPPDRDPHGTTYSQVEQASEPAPGFGFRGSAGTIMARGELWDRRPSAPGRQAG